MKLKFTLLAVIGMSLSLLMATPSHATEDPAKEKTAKGNSRNNNAVKIYPDPVKRVMHVVARGSEGKEIDFFVFDLEGTLIQHYKMENGDRQRLANLKRGKYVYHVFSGDEETATGEFEMR